MSIQDKYNSLSEMLSYSVKMSLDEFKITNSWKLEALCETANRNYDEYARDVYLFMKECTQNKLLRADMIRNQMEYIY